MPLFTCTIQVVYHDLRELLTPSLLAVALALLQESVGLHADRAHQCTHAVASLLGLTSRVADVFAALSITIDYHLVFTSYVSSVRLEALFFPVMNFVASLVDSNTTAGLDPDPIFSSFADVCDAPHEFLNTYSYAVSGLLSSD